MSMHTYIKGYRSGDPTLDKHTRVLKFCLQEGVSLPFETAKYFDWPTESGTLPGLSILDDFLEVDLEAARCIKRVDGDMSDVWEIDLNKVPEGVTKIRFVNSY
jgi:hypothetical protein